jgi:diaminohydroxyphosphoribosylaminopyrimidine deaminase/5-amino-6-(5-phosphoribosylamino)uracil reductase
VIDAGIRRVVIAHVDPFPAVAGQGIEQLRQAGIEVEVGVGAGEAAKLLAPFRKLVQQQVPWMIAKWAMTLDGKLASHTGHSRWISSETSRRRVHELRRRVDAIMVGRRTVEIDNPTLTARPAGERCLTRVVVDSLAAISLQSRLVESARQTPVLIAVSQQADPQRCKLLVDRGCDVVVCPGESPAERLTALLAELGRRRMTNVVVEGGGQLLGSLFDMRQIDELHVFVAPKLVGGAAAPSPLAGVGQLEIPQMPSVVDPHIEVLEQDVYITGRVAYPELSGSA